MTPDLPSLTSQLSINEEDILDLLRAFIDDMGKALSKTIRDSRDVFNKYVKDTILKKCKEKNPDFISTFEYSGNLYENLMTEGQDDDDVLILVVLKKKKHEITPILNEAGYGEFQLQGTKYEQFSDGKDFVSPEKIRKWFFKIVKEEAESSASEFGLDLKISQPVERSPMKLDIIIFQQSCQEKQMCARNQAASNVWVKKSSLRVCLMPAFEVGRKFFVPLEPHCFEDSAKSDASHYWKQSFSLEMKAVLQDMDKDGGCRHDLFKVVNTILKREPTFSKLLPHMKMLFVSFINDSNKNWDKSKLGERFKEFFSFLANLLENKKLKHFWLQDVNLLSDVPPMTLENMEKRVRRILSSDQEKQKILKY